MSLEVDARDANGKIYNDTSEEKIMTAHPPTFAPDHKPYPQYPPPNEEAITRLKRRNLYLLIALVVALIAAIVAAAVGGVLASQRQNIITQLRQSPTAASSDPQENTTCSSTPSNTTTAVKWEETLSPTSVQPSSDCSSFADTYRNPYENSGNLTSYDIACGTKLRGSRGQTLDFMAIWVYTFRDCINACANYNQGVVRQSHHPNTTCYGVNFLLKPERARYQGNCGLKGSSELNRDSDDGQDSALLILEGAS